MKKLHRILCIAFLTFATGYIPAQNIGINTTGAAPNSAAILDIGTGVSNMGLLCPQVALTSIYVWTPVVGVATNGMLVYNTSATTTSGSGIGYYYWANAKWNYMLNSGSFGGLNQCNTLYAAIRIWNATTWFCSNIYDQGSTISIFKPAPSAGYLFDEDPGNASVGVIDTRILAQTSSGASNGGNLFLGAGSGAAAGTNGGNVYIVPGAKVTTGIYGSAVLGSGDKTATPLGYTLRTPNAITGAGADIAGTNLTITSGNGVGAGGSGNVIFQTAPVAASGNTADLITEIMRVTPTGALAFSGAAGYGTAGLPLTSNGNAAPAYKNYVTSGTINAVTFSPTASTIGSATTSFNVGMYWDNVNGYLGIGTTTPAGGLIDYNGGASIGYAAAAPNGGLIVSASTAIGIATPGNNILNVQGGTGAAAGPGIIMVAGSGGAFGGKGGTINITAGNNGAGGASAGTLSLTPGSTGTGTPGVVNLNGNITITKGSVAVTSGAINDLIIGNYAFVKITGATAGFTLNSFTNDAAAVPPVDGEQVIIYNSTAFAMTIGNNGGGTAANEIVTNTGGGVGAHCATLMYDGAQSRWVLISKE
ncbi:MAG TPA: hypothetical protein VNZ86_08475 [Bacteroidia bacterium]|jgi:hypothetical protein|nr:hypothetical protein [Bacteroidia bacterium]